MGHVDGRLAQSPLEVAQFGPHHDAQLQIEIGQRLVEQQQARLENDGPRDGDTLLLPAG